jgi:hypothetical protein
VRVSDVHASDDSVSFRVSRTGVPVVVRTSYYPNWEASGANGPWRLTPNFMVVVPTSRSVTLHYARSGAEWAGIGLSAVGVVGLVGLVVWRPRDGRDGRVRTDPQRQEPAGSDPGSDPGSRADAAVGSENAGGSDPASRADAGVGSENAGGSDPASS